MLLSVSLASKKPQGDTGGFQVCAMYPVSSYHNQRMRSLEKSLLLEEAINEPSLLPDGRGDNASFFKLTFYLINLTYYNL